MLPYRHPADVAGFHDRPAPTENITLAKKKQEIFSRTNLSRRVYPAAVTIS
jgi:hypothetical protein